MNAPAKSTGLTFGHVLFLAALLIAPGLALGHFAGLELAAWIAGGVILISLATFGAYAWDKRRARAAEWRTPENILHLWELIGGWPGAYLAQRIIRHKSSKTSYLVVFWLIVSVYQYIAIDSLLGWPLFHQLRALFV
jgi:uncharacterized membrane protein YsdA (DUF1294 family)